MPPTQYYTYTIRDRETDEVLFTGTSGECMEYLGCSRTSVIAMAKRCWATEQGYFNSRYIITREASKRPVRRKHYRVCENGELVVEGTSVKCAKALGIRHDRWYQFVFNCSTQEKPRYTITSDWE